MALQNQHVQAFVFRFVFSIFETITRTQRTDGGDDLTLGRATRQMHLLCLMHQYLRRQVNKKAQALAGFLSGQPEVQRQYAALQLANKLISQCEVQASQPTPTKMSAHRILELLSATGLTFPILQNDGAHCKVVAHIRCSLECNAHGRSWR